MWLKDEPYMLPNEELLVREREGIRRAFEAVFGIIEIQRTAAKMSQEKLKIKKA
jgi:hypothetical protein